MPPSALVFTQARSTSSVFYNCVQKAKLFILERTENTSSKGQKINPHNSREFLQAGIYYHQYDRDICLSEIIYFIFEKLILKYMISATAVMDQENTYKRYKDAIVWKYANMV